MKSCTIVSVVHKPKLSDLEALSLKKCIEVFEYWFNRTNHVLPMGIRNFYKHDALEFCHKFLKLES